MQLNSCDVNATRCGGCLISGKTLAQLVQEYIDVCRPVAAAELRFFATQSLARAIEFAALCLNSSGRRSSHQWRRSLLTLAEAHDVLRGNSHELPRCRTFSELHDLIDRLVAHIPDLGPLYSYDAAVHIGARLGLAPHEVYLHCGTREGARALGLPFRQPTLHRTSLPAALHKLAMHEVEDFLCIFKTRLHAALHNN
jgi:hypothetical protein